MRDKRSHILIFIFIMVILTIGLISRNKQLVHELVSLQDKVSEYELSIKRRIISFYIKSRSWMV